MAAGDGACTRPCTSRNLRRIAAPRSPVRIGPCNLSALDPMAPRSKGTTLVTRRVVVTVLLAAIGATACSRTKAMPSAKPSSGDAGSAADIRHGRPRPGELHVLVVDWSGAPLSGVSVSGDYQKNSPWTESTCCFDETLGERTTGRDGVAVLDAPPRTSRSYEVTASRQGWPPQSVSIGRFGVDARRDAWGRVVITLGPPREIRGRVELGADCPPEFVEVTGAPPIARALVDSDGQFVLRGLSPSAVSIAFSACGRDAGATVEPGTSASIVLTLPPRTPGNWPFDAPSSTTPRPPSASGAPPTTPLPCLQPSGELIAAGDFDSIVLGSRGWQRKACHPSRRGRHLCTRRAGPFLPHRKGRLRSTSPTLRHPPSARTNDRNRTKRP